MANSELRKKVLEKIRVQPQAWQVLWTDCGMPQPASEFKEILEDMVKKKQIDFKFIAGSKYYFKGQYENRN